MVAEKRKERRLYARLGNILQLQNTLALGNGMTELANILKPVVETACRNALGIVGMRFVDSAPDALNVLAGKR